MRPRGQTPRMRPIAQETLSPGVGFNEAAGADPADAGQILGETDADAWLLQ